MLWAVKGNGISAYLKEGFNVLKRFKAGEEKNDKVDCFMWICSAKNLKDAKKLVAKQEGEAEIREFKIRQPEKDL